MERKLKLFDRHVYQKETSENASPGNNDFPLFASGKKPTTPLCPSIFIFILKPLLKNFNSKLIIKAMEPSKIPNTKQNNATQ